MKTTVTKLVIPLFLAAAVCGFLLSGCGTADGDSAASAPESVPLIDMASSPTVSEPVLSGDLMDAINRTAVAVTDGVTVAANPYAVRELRLAARSKYRIIVYKGSQSVVVYGKDGSGEYTKEINIFTCSTGERPTATAPGKYNIRAKYRWRYLVGGVFGQYSSSISPYYLFHSVPYHKMDPATLEDEEYDKLGSPASKGCIRMCVRDCKWIYDNCPVGTEVVIVEDSGPKGPGVPQRSFNADYSGWDPSDRWAPGNPYFNQTIAAAPTEGQPITAPSVTVSASDEAASALD